MNFVKSSESYQSTDVSHVHDQHASSRQGFRGGQRGYNGPAPGHPNMTFQNFGGPRGGYNTPQGPFSSRGHRGGGGGFGRPSGRFSNPSNFNQQAFGNTQRMNRPAGGFGGGGGPQHRFSHNSGQGPSPTQYGGFVKPEKTEDRFEGGDGEGSQPQQSSVDRPMSAPSLMRHPYTGPRFQGGQANRSTGRFANNVEGGGPLRAGGRGFGRGGGGGGPRFGGGTGRGGAGAGSENFSNVEAANAAAARMTRDARNLHAKCIVLATDNVHLTKFQRLAGEIKKLKSKRPNAVDTVHSAANIAQVNIQSEIESGPIVRGTGTFFCSVQFDGVNVAVATGLNKRAAKNEAFDVALQKLMKPFQRIVEIDGSTKEFQAADYDFSAEPPRQTVIKPTSMVVSDISGKGGDSMENAIQRESNVEALMDIRKKSYDAKDLNDFILVEPEEHNSSVNGASMLRRSADFSKMLLEYDFAAFGTGGSVRCILKVEGQVLADVKAYSKMAAKIEASQNAVDVLRQQCWTILTKQVHDSNTPEITKDEMFADLASSVAPKTNAASMATPIADGNLGKKLLQKMGWTGGGIGKDGMGIEEPVTMKQIINREGLGLDTKRGITGDFRSRITEVLENYASSERQDDLVFSPHFRKDERIIIHNECRRLSLKSKSNGTANTRYLIVRRKRSAAQLLYHVMDCGGETARYKVVPPGQRRYPWRPVLPPGANSTAGSASKTQVAASATSKAGLLGAPPTSQGQNPQPLMGQNPQSLMGQNSQSLMGQNSQSLMGQNSQSLMGQNPQSLMGQNPQSLMGQNPQSLMGQNPQSLMGQNPQSLMGQNPQSLMGQNPQSLMGQNPQSLMGQNPQSLMGQNPQSLMGQNPQSLMGQNPQSLMGQNSQALLGQVIHGLMGQNTQSLMGQNLPGLMGQNSQSLMGQNPQSLMGQNPQPFLGQNPQTFIGQNPGNQQMQNPCGPSGFVGNNFSGVVGSNPTAAGTGNNAFGLLGQNPSAGMM